MFNGRSAFFQWIFHWSPFSRQGAKCWVCLNLLVPDLCQYWTTCLLYFLCSLRKCSDAQIRLPGSNQLSFHQYISYFFANIVAVGHRTQGLATLLNLAFFGGGVGVRGGWGAKCNWDGADASAEAGRQLFRELASWDRAWPWKLQAAHADWITKVSAAHTNNATVESEWTCAWIVTLVPCFNRYIQRSTRRAELTDPVPHKLSTLQVRQAEGIQAWAEKGTSRLWDRTNEFKLDSACAIHIWRWGPLLTAFHRLCGSLWSSRTSCCNGLSPIQLLCRSLFCFSDS